jgi:glucose-6-phosphate 1-epimerase
MEIPEKQGSEKVFVSAPDGARMEMHPYGAHVTSWLPAGGAEWIFLSPRTVFKDGVPIHGGAPVIFPQFSGLGPLPKHGFLRSELWDLLESGLDYAEFGISDNEYSHQYWSHEFKVRYRVSLSGKRLEMRLFITNTGNSPFSFTAALHTYFKVADVRKAAVQGLDGLAYLDTAGENLIKAGEAGALTIPGEVDRVYFGAPRTLHLLDGERRLAISADGFTDAVVWNPGPEKGPTLPDLDSQGYLEFLCIEAAAVDPAITVLPGDTWQGAQILEA